MKVILYVLAANIFVFTANAQLIHKIEPVNINSQRTEAQREVGKYRPMEKNIEYMLEHYTDGELRNYAKALNQQQIDAAKAAKMQIPEKLSEETLKSRKKIGQYLRSYFNIEQ